jgi:translation elongation factor EF-G
MVISRVKTGRITTWIRRNVVQDGRITAFRNVAPKARPVVLEPLADIEVWTPEDVLGDVMGDLSARRGQILGTEVDGRLTRVRAIVPEAELYRYSTSLHSITHGRGTFRHFHGYVEALEVVAKVGELQGRGGGKFHGAPIRH